MLEFDSASNPVASYGFDSALNLCQFCIKLQESPENPPKLRATSIFG